MQPPAAPAAQPPAPATEAEEAEAMYARRGCCCFWIPWSATSPPPPSAEWWERVSPPPPHGAGGAGPWWKRGLTTLMKIREWSEMVAGPRWKTFIRRFNKNSRQRRWRRNQYDASSYALNFDEGRDESPDRDGGFRDFSSRYAVLPASAKASMDLGGRDAPPLFTADPVVEVR